MLVKRGVFDKIGVASAAVCAQIGRVGGDVIRPAGRTEPTDAADVPLHDRKAAVQPIVARVFGGQRGVFRLHFKAARLAAAAGRQQQQRDHPAARAEVRAPCAAAAADERSQQQRIGPIANAAAVLAQRQMRVDACRFHTCDHNSRTRGSSLSCIANKARRAPRLPLSAGRRRRRAAA